MSINSNDNYDSNDYDDGSAVVSPNDAFSCIDRLKIFAHNAGIESLDAKIDECVNFTPDALISKQTKKSTIDPFFEQQNTTIMTKFDPSDSVI